MREFRISQGTVATFFRYDAHVHNRLHEIYLGFCFSNIILIR